ncbi:sugar phosphate isomerase/epimerase family protein [Thorsellia kenyensis]|uniref:Sugar phosphate isomerase/epimerase family protein n=1 Tax=Thorsellia kenyensis TaxID=1549888 RepID=A0ABV6C7B8_9GAMM
MPQEILFFAPIWGNTSSFDTFISNALEVGFDGVEMALLGTDSEIECQLELLESKNLKLIAQQWLTAFDADFETHKKTMIKVLTEACRYKPLKINTQTGKDFYDFEQNVELIETAEDIAAKSGVEIVHEIHRSRFNAHPKLLLPYLAKFPTLKLTADFSHWCCVCESLLEDQSEMINSIIPFIRHTHARVGYSQGPQVNDFLAKENELALLQHLSWWDKIVDNLISETSGPVTFTPEFGPAPYMPCLPHTLMPVVCQWQQNVEMMRLLKARYQLN